MITKPEYDNIRIRLKNEIDQKHYLEMSRTNFYFDEVNLRDRIERCDREIGMLTKQVKEYETMQQ